MLRISIDCNITHRLLDVKVVGFCINFHLMRALVMILFLGLGMGLEAQQLVWTPLTSGVNFSLNDLHFIDGQTGYVVGSNGTILKTVDGGMNWIGQNSGTNQPLNAVYFCNPDTGWVVGGSSQALLLKTEDGGANWNSIATGINSGPLLDIEFQSSGLMGLAITSDSIYHSIDCGITWAVEEYSGINGTPVNACIEIRGQDTAYIGGRRFQTGTQDSSPEVYTRIHNLSGYVWVQTSSNQFSNMDRIESLAFNTDSTAFAGGIQGKIYCLSATPPNLTGPWNLCVDLGSGNNQTIQSLEFVDEMNGMFNSPFQAGPVGYSMFYYTFDGGINWAQLDTVDGFLINASQYLSTTLAYAVGNNGDIYKGQDPNISVAENWNHGDLLIYPNPSSDRIKVYLRDQNDYLGLNVWDILGQSIPVYYEFQSDGLSIPIHRLRSGIYILEVVYTDGRIHRKRFIRK